MSEYTKVRFVFARETWWGDDNPETDVFVSVDGDATFDAIVEQFRAWALAVGFAEKTITQCLGDA